MLFSTNPTEFNGFLPTDRTTTIPRQVKRK
jgi:hypothetical protein